MQQHPDDQLVDPELRPFTDWLGEQRNGSLLNELTTEVARLTLACLQTDKKGTLTLKVTCTPSKDGATVLFTDDVVCKAPEPDRGAMLFFVDEHGNAQRRDPRQPSIPGLAAPKRTSDIVVGSDRVAEVPTDRRDPQDAVDHPTTRPENL